MARMMAMLLLSAVLIFSVKAYDESQWTRRTRPSIIGHRGAPAYFPEHSRSSYLLSIASGADFFECDVCWSKDLVPICRHEPWLSATTNVMNTTFKFKTTTYLVDGFNVTDVFANDLTWAELKTLRLKQKDAFRPTQFDGIFRIVSLEEYLQIALNADRTVGVYPEMKHPTYFNNLPQIKAAKTTIMDLLLKTLAKYGYDRSGPVNSVAWRGQPIFIQSFEQNDLVYISKRSCIPLVQLFSGPGSVTPDRNKSYEDLISDKSLDEIATYASGAGPFKGTLLAPDSTGKIVSSGLTKRLQSRGMMVHLYTLRPEPQYIISALKNTTVFNELDQYLKIEGVDGGFTDSPTLFSTYLKAQDIAGYKWNKKMIARWNARTYTCKKAC